MNVLCAGDHSWINLVWFSHILMFEEPLLISGFFFVNYLDWIWQFAWSSLYLIVEVITTKNRQ